MKGGDSKRMVQQRKKNFSELAVKSWYNKVTTRCGPESNVGARLTEFGQIYRCRSVDNSIH